MITPSKIVATLIATGWFIAIFTDAGQMTPAVAKSALALLLPLALIWFPEQLGSFTGYVGRGGNIDTPTPSVLISAVGWFILIGLPVVMYLLARSV
jgi:hypothetical protein